jgi:GntR family transcriptional regulator / MocR family aminotransferase
MRPFRMSLPALDEFPDGIWSRLVARHAHRMPRSLMGYCDPAGLGALRMEIAEHLRTARGVRCEADQILITSGSQAALRICAGALLAHGDRVVIEEPGYPGARTALAAAGATLRPVGVDDDGIDVDSLAKLRGPIRAVYVTPSHQYPLGVSITAARRLALLDWAERLDAWVFEDDYDSEFRYVSRPLGALQGMDRNDRVIYIGTFSKVLFPAIRVGYIVVPAAIWNTFVAVREALDVFSPVLYQLALADFLREGHFARHLRRMRSTYMARRAALLAGLADHAREVLTVHNADAGLHVTTYLPENVDDASVVSRLAAARLSAIPLSSCYIGAPRRNGLLLGFGGFPAARIAVATQSLGTVLREFMDGRNGE